jgi:cytoskeletal protein CcmA (bactofilin family)
MFKKNKSMDFDERPSSDPVQTTDKTIIGEQIVIEGDISGNGDLVIEGSVKGRIQVETHHLTVGPKGNVESEIHAAEVTISGKLVGNIDAKGKVVITKDADFKGEIKARSISVEDGALLKAVIELSKRDEKRKPSVGKTELKVPREAESEPPAPSSEAKAR